MMVVTIKNVTIEITQYGKSMYGGWYANFRYVAPAEYENKMDGIRRDTLKEICAQLHVSKTALRRDVYRLDN